MEQTEEKINEEVATILTGVELKKVKQVLKKLGKRTPPTEYLRRNRGYAVNTIAWKIIFEFKILKQL